MKKYKLTLEILTPVYIGNGNKITKKDFKLNGNYIDIYDPIRLYDIYGKSYEEFLMSPKNLTDYLNYQSQRKHPCLKAAKQYSIINSDKIIRKSDSIEEFIKDPYNYPYIPGSTIKGAIRTAVLSHEIKNHPNRYTKYRKENIRSSWEMEKDTFGDVIRDKFKYLQISDSKPLEIEDLIACKKVDVFKDGKSNNKLNICREALKPGTKVEFDIIIKKIDGKEVFSKDYIMESINSYSDIYRSEYLKKFKLINDNDTSCDTIYLGGGTGFLTKTVNQALYQDRALYEVANYLNSKLKRHNHRKDISLGISPRARKCTILNSKTVDMGLCKVRID